MVAEIISVCLKVVLQLVVWVFILSIQIEDKLIFDHAHDFLVKNQVVDTLSAQFGQLWNEVMETARSGAENAPTKTKEVL